MAKSDTSKPGDTSRTARKSRLVSMAASIGLALLIGSCCLCGGAIYYQWPAFHSDREEAIAITNQILPVTVPESFTAEGTIVWKIWMFLTMEGAYYTHRDGPGELSFLEVESRFLSNDDFRAHILRSLREHGAGGGFDLKIRNAETKTYDINGQPAEFRFLEAEDRTTGNGRRLVDGIVQGINGPVMVSLWVDEQNWDPQMVDDMIASIGTLSPRPDAE